MIQQPAATVKQVHLLVKYWWPGIIAEKAFDLFDAPYVPLVARTTDPTGQQWRPARPGATLADVAGYMLDNDLIIMDTQLIAQRRNPRWEGLYQVTIGKSLPQLARAAQFADSLHQGVHHA